jgi:hypothetical protein
MKVELSAPYTQSQNGGAERSGGVGSERRSKTREGAKPEKEQMPAALWPEINRAFILIAARFDLELIKYDARA